jgi:hypothetical protein
MAMTQQEFKKRLKKALTESAGGIAGSYAGYEFGRRVDPGKGAAYTVAGAAIGQLFQVAVKMFGSSDPTDAQLRKLFEERASLVYLVRGKDGSRRAWHYVLVDKPRLNDFKRQVATGSIDVSRYGRTLYSDFGDSPPPNIVSAINREYSF